MTLLFESFGYKQGIPLDADLVFDVRCLPNPYYDAALRPLTGLDPAVVDFLERLDDVKSMDRRHPRLRRELAAGFLRDNRSLPHRGDRLHRRPAPLGVLRRTPRAALPRRHAGAGAPPTAASGTPRMSQATDLTTADLADLPIFPLGTVLFPGGLLPLRVFEARYVDMTGDCMKRGKPFGVCLIREGREVGAPAVPEPFGCLAHIADWDMQDLGVLQIVTHGGQRFRLGESRVTEGGLIRGAAELVAPEADMPLPERFAPCARLLQMIVMDRSQEVFVEPHRFDDAAWVGYRLSEVLPVPLAAKQKLLELEDTTSRLEILLRYLEQRGLAAAG